MNPGFSGPGDDSDPRAHDCPGLLLFIYDDDFWGCELVHHGTVIDQFQQETDNIGSFFGDLPCQGRPDLLLAQFPALDLDIEHARAYLTHYSIDDPAYEDIDWENEHDPRNSPARAMGTAALKEASTGTSRTSSASTTMPRSGGGSPPCHRHPRERTTDPICPDDRRWPTHPWVRARRAVRTPPVATLRWVTCRSFLGVVLSARTTGTPIRGRVQMDSR